MAIARLFKEGMRAIDKRMPGKHMKGKRDAAVAKLRKHFASELEKDTLIPWL